MSESPSLPKRRASSAVSDDDDDEDDDATELLPPPPLSVIFLRVGARCPAVRVTIAADGSPIAARSLGVPRDFPLFSVTTPPPPSEALGRRAARADLRRLTADVRIAVNGNDNGVTAPLRHRSVVSLAPAKGCADDLFSAVEWRVLVEDAPQSGANWLFYSNRQPSFPDGALIEEIHQSWAGNYHKLEAHHGYIQWLFPLYLDSGVNWEASPLLHGEARLIRSDPDASRRVLESYRLMLDFYGFRLADAATGRLEKLPPRRWDGLENLAYSQHNCLRITRILTALGHLGFGRYKRPLVEALAAEVEAGGPMRHCRYSLVHFWRPMLDMTSEAYLRKTLETEEDSDESIFFSSLSPLPPPAPVAVVTAAETVDADTEPIMEDEQHHAPVSERKAEDK